MTTLTKQELFNTAYVGLAKQGWRKAAVINEFGQTKCKYRIVIDDETLKCAIGHCIPDDLYDYVIEGYSAYSAVMAVGLSIGHRSSEMIGFLESLQSCHDSSTNPEQMKKNFLAFAETHGLTVPGLTVKGK